MSSKRNQPNAGVEQPKRAKSTATSPFELQGNEVAVLGPNNPRESGVAVRNPQPEPEVDSSPSSPSTFRNDDDDVQGPLVQLHAAALDDAVPNISDGFKVSEYWGVLRGANPFWITTTSENTTYYRRIRYTFANHPPPNRTPPPLVLLGSHRLSEQVVHLDDAIRVYACRVFLRNLQITENDITDNILKLLFDVDSAVAGGWRSKIMRYQTTWQSQMLGWMLSGVTTLVGTVGTAEKWASSTPAQRRELFAAYYDQDPKFSFFLFFRGCFYGVDIHGIYANNEPERRKWQRYFKTVFLWVAEDTYSLRIKNASSPDNPEPVTYVASNLKQMAWSDVMEPLALGDIDHLPVSRTGVFDLQRRALLEPVLVEEGGRVLAE